jgi:hypothetical protein
LSIHSLSIFPLFPYAGFAFAGAAFGYLHLLSRERGGEAVFLRRCAMFAVALCLGGPAAGYLLHFSSHFWSGNPLSFLVRVGILLLLVAVARIAEPRLMPRFGPLAVLGKQSLLIYVAHLPILFGSAFNPETSLRGALGVPLGVSDAILVWLALTGIMAVLAIWWDRWSRDHAWQARAVWWLIVAYYCGRFLLT